MAARQEASTGKMVDDGKPALKPQQMTDKTGAPMMHVKIYSPFKIYLDQPAYSISGVNPSGPFDILPRHHNFIALLSSGALVVRTDAGSSEVKIAGGIMHVKADEVTVFLDV